MPSLHPRSLRLALTVSIDWRSGTGQGHDIQRTHTSVLEVTPPEQGLGSPAAMPLYFIVVEGRKHLDESHVEEIRLGPQC